MIPESPQPEEEQLIAWLAACDGALAAGAPVSSVDDSTLPTQERGRLRRDLNCVDLLRRCLGATPSMDGNGAGLSQRTSPAPDLPSRIGRFEIRRELGQGGFGIVFLAFDPQLGREVALKIPRSEVFLNRDVRVRFQIEARIAAALDHPHIAPIYDAGEIGPVCYIASAYCPGPTLVEWLREQTHSPTFEVAAEVISLLADAVQHAHSRGVLHRDLKPGNIILTPTDRSGTPASKGNRLDFIPRLTDFGLAKFIESPLEGPTQSNAVLGTPEYMAPNRPAAACGKSVPQLTCMGWRCPLRTAHRPAAVSQRDRPANFATYRVRGSDFAAAAATRCATRSGDDLSQVPGEGAAAPIPKCCTSWRKTCGDSCPTCRCRRDRLAIWKDYSAGYGEIPRWPSPAVWLW